LYSIFAASTNNSSVLSPVFAEVSKNKSKSKSFCSCCPCSVVINRDASKSALFPIKKTLISGLALALKSFIHKSMSSKLFALYFFYYFLKLTHQWRTLLLLMNYFCKNLLSTSGKFPARMCPKFAILSPYYQI